jgi:hypothetical protein
MSPVALSPLDGIKQLVDIVLRKFGLYSFMVIVYNMIECALHMIYTTLHFLQTWYLHVDFLAINRKYPKSPPENIRLNVFDLADIFIVVQRCCEYTLGSIS